MIRTRNFLTPGLHIIQVFSLLAILLASGCAPALASPTPALPLATVAPVEEAVPTAPAVQPEATLPATQAATQPLATSRGSNLEATDPSTVNLASGGLQLIEFFRFT